MSNRSFYSVCLILLISSSHAQTNRNDLYDWDKRMKDIGFVDVCFWEPSIQYHLFYATANNFLKKPIYNSKLTKVWLHPRAAQMLIHAQDLLQKEHPELALFVYDAARPIEAQRIMSAWAKQTKNDNFVADPSKGGGQHNYGMAVDVTLANHKGEGLPMGTSFDFFGPEARTDKENDLLKNRRITPIEYKNRQLLRRIMESAGFTSIRNEWWHFNACTREEAMSNYILIDR